MNPATQPGNAGSMTTRRQFLRSLVTGASIPAIAGCDSGSSLYEQAVRRTWSGEDLMRARPRHEIRSIIRNATLAASSHNTQPWKFKTQGSVITILPDLARRCPVVDPDDHHLFASLGCALENLEIAARALGFQPSSTFDDSADGSVRVELTSGPAVESPLAGAIPHRQSSRALYDGQPVSPSRLRVLEASGIGAGTGIMLLTQKAQLERVLEYVVAGNTAQLADPTFVGELKKWIRFDDSDAVRAGDGLSARASGNPTAPPWLGRTLLNVFLTARSENEKYRKHIRSSAGIAVFFSENNDKAHWIEAGRACERFCLQAAVLDLRTAFINQPVEVVPLRGQFASYLGIGQRRPDLIVRFGHGPAMPRSLRRPIDDVII
jgi:hypothetical protein